MSELNDFLKLISEGKKNDPVAVKAKEFESTIKESVKSDLSSLFSELSSLKQKKAQLIEAKPELIEEEKIQEEVITEVAPPLPTPIGKVPVAVQIPDIDKYLKTKSITPQADPLTNEFKQVSDKIKFLERWIGQIQNAGPGGGAGDVINLDHQTTIVTTSTYTVGRKDYYVGINYAGQVNVTLPNNVKAGRYIIIKDESGRCSKFPIIVHGNVDNDPEGFILRINNGAIQMIYRNGWRIV